MRPIIAHLIASNFYGGPERQIVQHCVRLRRMGWPAVVGSFRENRPRVDVLHEAELQDLPTFAIDTRTGFSPLAIPRLVSALRRHGVDLLVTHGYKSAVVGHHAARGLGLPRVSFLRGFTAENFRVRAYERLERAYVRRADLVVCVCEAMRRRMEAAGIPAARLRVVHNAVHVDVEQVQPLDVRAAFGLPADSRVLVAVGRLSPEKGQPELLQALPAILARAAAARLLLVGHGFLEPALREQCRDLGLERAVTFTGFRTDALAIMAGADLLVLPSRSEGLPNVVLEAFALGLPVVATGVGGVPEIVEDQRSGWIVPPRRPDLLAAAVLEALAQPALARARAEQARADLQQRFAPDVQTRTLVAVYQDALATRRPRAAAVPGGVPGHAA